MDAFAVVAMKRIVRHGFQRRLDRIARNPAVSRDRTRRFAPMPYDGSHGLTAAGAMAATRASHMMRRFKRPSSTISRPGYASLHVPPGMSISM